MKNRAFDYDLSRYPNWIDPNEVTPYERNAKLHDERQIENIANSIKRLGWQQDTVLTRDKVCVIGHGRREAAMLLGCKMPYHYVDKNADELTEDDIRELRDADNLTNAMTGFDRELLEMDFKELDFSGFDFEMSAFGFTNDVTTEAQEPEVVEDEAPEPPEEPKTKLGDIYQLGQHRLICGDSADANTIDRLMDGVKADLLLTDPPYNCNVGFCERPTSAHNGVSILNDNMDEEDFINFLSSALYNADQSMKPGAAYYIWYAGLHHIEFENALRRVENFKLHEQLIWVKSHFILGRNSDYQWMHENCLSGWKNGAAHYFFDSRQEATVFEDKAVKLSTMKKGELIKLCEKLMGLDKACTVLRADKINAATLHPTVKPQDLLAPLILNSTKRGWSVLDIFGGSGSTLIACQQLNRKCYMCELDPHYCDVIIERWENFTGEKAVLLNG